MRIGAINWLCVKDCRLTKRLLVVHHLNCFVNFGNLTKLDKLFVKALLTVEPIIRELLIKIKH